MKKLEKENRRWWSGGFTVPFRWMEALLIRAGLAEEIPPVTTAAFEEAA